MKVFLTQHKTLFCLAFVGMVLGLFASCAEPQKKYRIGVSQCSEDIWRFKQNDEFRMSQYADPRIDLEILSADDSDTKQIGQIAHFIDNKVDLLIVASNSSERLSGIIGKAYDQGIPVVLFDRKTCGGKYTAFMGTDNYRLGQMMGKYIARQMEGKGTVAEITGLKTSSPAKERHRGFMDAMRECPGITVVSTELGDWTEKSGETAMRSLLGSYHGRIDCVFGHNDRLAMGARKVAMEQGLDGIKYYGVDALPTEGGGMRLVQDGVLEATCVYPTRGLQLMRLATHILDGKKYEKNNMLTSTIVDRDNVDILLSQNIEQQRVSDDLKAVKGRLDIYFTQVNLQRKVIIAFIIVLVVIITLGVLAYRFYIAKVLVNEELAKDVTVPVDVPKSESPFVERFRSILQQNLHDADFNVERIGGEMGLSRVQLYRKVKSLTGMTPVELLCKARITRGRHLLETTDRSVSEIAFEVGFTAPSYFAKCFKDEYGKVPGRFGDAIRKSMRMVKNDNFRSFFYKYVTWYHFCDEMDDFLRSWSVVLHNFAAELRITKNGQNENEQNHLHGKNHDCSRNFLHTSFYECAG